MLAAQLLGNETLVGHKVSLQRIGVQHAEFLYQCYQNDDFMDLYRLAQNRAETITKIRARLLKNSEYTAEQLHKFEWVIHKNTKTGELGQAIGLVSVADYMKSHRRAELLLGIADKKQRQSGLISLEVTLLVLEFAFKQLNLNKFLMLVYEHNQFAHKNAMNFGFKAEGFFAEHTHYPNKGFVGMYQNAFFAKDFWNNPKIKRWSLRVLKRDTTQQPAENRQLSSEELNQANQALHNFLQ